MRARRIVLLFNISVVVGNVPTTVLYRSVQAQILAVNPRPSRHCESMVEWADVAI